MTLNDALKQLDAALSNLRTGALRQVQMAAEDVRRVLAEGPDPEPASPGAAVPAGGLRGRSLLSAGDLTRDEVGLVLKTAAELKTGVKRNPPDLPPLLRGKTLAMVFEKPSLRTRVSFETGMTQLGGHAINLQPAEIQLGQRETIADAARTLGRMVDVIMARTFAHQTVVELAAHAGVPVINGLSDREHPCQALADFLTIQEKKGRLEGLRMAWVGDGNNVCHSNMLLAARTGAHFVVACPEGYEPDAEIVAAAVAAGEESGARVEITHSPEEAAAGADVLFTDVWASMGQESERAVRAQAFARFQLNQGLVDRAQPDCIVLHCLPAHRGDEITDEVIDGPHSVVFDEAENRLHAQKALLVLVA